MKPVKILLGLAVFVAATGAIAWGAAAYAGGRFKSPEDARAATCSAGGQSHLVVIDGDKAVPWHTYAARCDTLTIRNADDVIRLIAFGPHEHHVAYDGVTEAVVGHDQSLTITLDAAGTYHFHDHIHDEVTGEFTVAP